ncbi:beta-hexosaminidase [Bacteroidales bacterium SW292]|nr:beta-hexosaminidase [Bacteroidales bacterium SW292]
MKIQQWITACWATLTLGLAACNGTTSPQETTLVPRPVSVEKSDGAFRFNRNTILAIADETQRPMAENFAALFTRSAGFTPTVQTGQEGDIVLIPDSTMKAEAYELKVTLRQITIKAADNRGYFYALQSLRLMLPPAVEEQAETDAVWAVPAVTLKDEPRFGYRGYMLDVARYFLPKEDVIRMIDCIAMLKINRLHLHLSDDNGWRLEIKKYPRLTEVGAWRVDRPGKTFPERRNPKPGEPTPIGGFYTQEDMKEIIRYAAERQIEVIPEIDIPAHSNAALAAYPEYACPVVKDFIGVLPGLGGNNSEIIFCAGNDKTYTFLQDILDEVMSLFPSRYVNLGGDEARKTNWKKCPLCQARIHREHLADEEALQGYFMGRMADYVRSKGKQVIGWDELTNSKLPDESIILGWQGYGQAALKAAAQGHRFIMAPARVLYLIRYQGPQWFEPFTYFGNNTLKNVYDYEPVQPDWKPEYEPLLMGVQGCMWTEFCNKPEDVFYLTFPRLAALAETAWSPKGQKDWPSFLKGLDNYIAHLSAQGITSARSMFNIQHTVTPTADGKLEAKLECERPDMEIRYTTDGSTPTAQSPLYEKKLVIDKDITIKAVTFAHNEQQGKLLVLPITWNEATARPLNGIPQAANVLVNGLRGSLKQTDFEWYTGDLGKDISFTVDLQEEKDIRECTIGCITNYGMGVHKPRTVKVELSIDNQTFTEAGSLAFTDADIFKEGNFIEDLAIKTDGRKARYVKFTLETPGNCPPDHVRPGQPSKIYIDEVIIK